MRAHRREAHEDRVSVAARLSPQHIERVCQFQLASHQRLVQAGQRLHTEGHRAARRQNTLQTGGDRQRLTQALGRHDHPQRQRPAKVSCFAHSLI